MLFDLQGKRRRLIQGTYLTLAILMGGGLVLFGIGSDVQGGLADIFTSGSGGSASPAIEDQLEEAQERLEANPDNPDALADVVQANYQLALSTDEQQRAVGGIFAEDAGPRLEAAADAYERYLEVTEQPDPSLANLAVSIYGVGLDQPEEAADAAEVVASEQKTTQAYLFLTQYAALAGNERKARLAGRRAVELAPQEARQQVERQVDSLIASARVATTGPEGGAAPGQLPLPGDDGVVAPGDAGGGGPGQGGETGGGGSGGGGCG